MPHINKLRSPSEKLSKKKTKLDDRCDINSDNYNPLHVLEKGSAKEKEAVRRTIRKTIYPE